MDGQRGCHGKIRVRLALVVFAVLGYYTGKYHLNDTMAFL